MRSEALHVKYRPRRFADVLGQEAIVASLQPLIKKGEQQAYLFTGPSGVGKTTLARICAGALGVAPEDVRETDAATFAGVDDMRAITSVLQYAALGGGGRAMIIDECHSLSKKAWESLYKSVEEPPPHAYWFFCTTEASKVPTTIKTRCAAYTLKPVAERAMRQLFDKVDEAEHMELSDEVADLIIREAGGSPRQMLVNMAVCQGAGTRKDAATLLRSAIGSEGAIELCRFLMGTGRSWGKAMAIVGKLTSESPEGVRIVVSNYFAKVAMGAKSDKAAAYAAHVLECFDEPYNQSDGLAPLVLSLARALLD